MIVSCLGLGYCNSFSVCTFFRSVYQKHLDVFASAFGFFLIGFDLISRYNSPERIPLRFFDLTSPLLWFFKVEDHECVARFTVFIAGIFYNDVFSSHLLATLPPLLEAV